MLGKAKTFGSLKLLSLARMSHSDRQARVHRPIPVSPCQNFHPPLFIVARLGKAVKRLETRRRQKRGPPRTRLFFVFQHSSPGLVSLARPIALPTATLLARLASNNRSRQERTHQQSIRAFKGIQQRPLGPITPKLLKGLS